VHGTNLHLDTQIISDISKKSNNHFGTFKRLYRDFVLDSNHSEDYYKFLINNFSTEEIATFKKKNSGIKLNPSEIMIQNMYKKVSFVKEDQLSIPVLAEKINDYKIKNVVEGSTERLAILDAGALTLTEKAIIEYMHKNIEVSKDQLALILWGDDANEKYSEWAMEQRMSRLRKKIQKMGYNINIETLYNKGYKLIIN